MMYNLGTPPVITRHPMNITIDLVNDTTSVSLTCEADGASSHNWERQNGVIPSDSTGISTTTLTLVNLQPEDAGNYRCVATNDSGSIASNYATVNINGENVKRLYHVILQGVNFGDWRFSNKIANILIQQLISFMSVCKARMGY